MHNLMTLLENPIIGVLIAIIGVIITSVATIFTIKPYFYKKKEDEIFKMDLLNKIKNNILDRSLLIDEKTQDFVGRKFIFKEINDFTTNNPSGYFIFRGEPGIGKSAFAAKFIKEKKCPYHFNIQLEGTGNSQEFLNNICAQMIIKNNFDPCFYNKEDKKELFLQLINKISKESHFAKFIMIDSLDEVNETKHLSGVNPLYLPYRLPNNIFIIITTRPLGDNSLRLNVDIRKEFILNADSKENQADILKYITNQAKDPIIKKYIKKINIKRKIFIKDLSNKIEGNFMYAKYIFPNIKDGTYTINSIPQGLNNYYEDHYQRMRKQDTKNWYEYKLPAIHALTATRSPISIKLISEFSKTPSEKLYIIKLIIEEWRQFLYETCIKNEGKIEKQYRWYHKSFYDFLKKKKEFNDEVVHSRIVDSMYGDFFKNE